MPACLALCVVDIYFTTSITRRHADADIETETRTDRAADTPRYFAGAPLPARRLLLSALARC